MFQTVTKELWTGQGREVKVGPNFSELASFQVGRGDDQKEFTRDLIDRLRDMREIWEGRIDVGSGLYSTRTEGGNPLELHELELVLKFPFYSYGGRQKHEELRTGAEFSKRNGENGKYNLKIFPKILTTAGSWQVVTDVDPQIIESFSPLTGLTYGVLQDNGYISKVEFL